MIKHSKTLALYGGSFDPPHLGHVAVVKAALQRLNPDKLIIMPAYLSPFKHSHAAPPDLRLMWLKKVMDFDPRIEVSDYELQKGGPSYTIDTVRHFAPLYDKIYLIIGADNLEGLPKWHRFDELNRMVTWVVATRGDVDIPKGFIRLDVDAPISSTRLRQTIDPQWIPDAVREEVIQYYHRNSKTPSEKPLSFRT